MDTPSRRPDVYIFGGSPASGKSYHLQKYVHEKAVMINNDDIKQYLTRYNRSPLGRKYGMAHATLLHEEASDIESKLVKMALKQRKDVILDRTLGNYGKYMKVA